MTRPELPTTGGSNVNGVAAVEGVPSAAAAPVTPSNSRVVLRLRDLTKVYPGVRALDRVSLELTAGTVHALVGENGAGKSTLLKLVSGAEVPSEGSIEIDDRTVEFPHPIAARRVGVVAVHQELAILPALTAMANVFLGQELRRARVVLDTRSMRRRFRELCEDLAVSIPPSRPAGGLSIANQQSLEIMRGLHADARILVLDEPTAALAVTEREALYAQIRGLREKGASILLISHDLDEVLALSDVVTVLRDGRRVATDDGANWTKESLVMAMLGHAVAPVRTRTLRKRAEDENLSVRSVHVPGRVHGVSFKADCGEIVGIAGLVGAGRTELLRAMVGLEPGSSGELRVAGRKVPWPKSPRAAMRRGVVLAPEDRKSQGLVQTLPAYANVTLTDPWQACSGPLLLASRERARAEEFTRGLGVDPDRLGAITATLSGGNQQKLVLAKWIATGVPVLLVDEPTRGIDVGAKDEVFTTLHGLADAGLSIVFVSSELEEVVDHSDRVLVMARGTLVGELPGHTASVAEVLNRIFIAEEAVS